MVFLLILVAREFFILNGLVCPYYNFTLRSWDGYDFGLPLVDVDNRHRSCQIFGSLFFKLFNMNGWVCLFTILPLTSWDGRDVVLRIVDVDCRHCLSSGFLFFKC